MSQFGLIAVTQDRLGPLLGLNIAASLGATAQIGAPRGESINLVGSADYCRPDS